jgi:hypothetical protein
MQLFALKCSAATELVRHASRSLERDLDGRGSLTDVDDLGHVAYVRRKRLADRAFAAGGLPLPPDLRALCALARLKIVRDDLRLA